MTVITHIHFSEMVTVDLKDLNILMIVAYRAHNRSTGNLN